MLRSLVLVLLLVNATFYAWTHGWLNGLVGAQSETQREPQRLNQQIHPEKLILVASQPDSGSSSPTQATAEPAAVPEQTVCLEAGPFDSNEASQVSDAMRTQMPAGSWTSETVSVPGEYLVYMGPYPDAAMYARKVQELKRMRNMTLEEIQSPPALAHGLSLGRFNRQDEAVAALEAWRARGVRTARVVTSRAPMDMQVIRVPMANAKTQVTLGGVKLPPGKAFSACRPQ
ncbi:MAG TPA: SPOR domain-containing protein [Aquabacterium sp.]|nr:SPOR domain-containing protein [Aquabacterium sp.]